MSAPNALQSEPKTVPQFNEAYNGTQNVNVRVLEGRTLVRPTEQLDERTE